MLPNQNGVIFLLFLINCTKPQVYLFLVFLLSIHINIIFSVPPPGVIIIRGINTEGLLIERQLKRLGAIAILVNRFCSRTNVWDVDRFIVPCDAFDASTIDSFLRPLLGIHPTRIPLGPVIIPFLKTFIAAQMTFNLECQLPSSKPILYGQRMPLWGLWDPILLQWTIAPEKQDPDLNDVMTRFGSPNDKESFFGPPSRYLPSPQWAEFIQIGHAVESQLVQALKERKGLITFHQRFDIRMAKLVAQLDIQGLSFKPGLLCRIEEEINEHMERNRLAVVASSRRKDLNVLSAKQIGDLLYDEIGLSIPSEIRHDPDRRTHTGRLGQRPTGDDVLSLLASKHPVADAIRAYRQAAKLIGTYVKPFTSHVTRPSPFATKDESAMRRETVYSRWNLTSTATGRLSSCEPNIQTIPNEITLIKGSGRSNLPDVNFRRAFIPSHGYDLMISADYSQIEPRVLSHYCGGELAKLFKRKQRKPVDIYAELAKHIDGIIKPSLADVSPISTDGSSLLSLRKKAKVVLLAVLYGSGSRTLANHMGSGVTVAQAGAIKQKILNRYPEIAQWTKKIEAQARMKGYAETISGRRRALLSAEEIRLAVNTTIQGSSADLLKVAVLSIAESFEQSFDSEKKPPRILATVHDEVLVECCVHDKEKVKEFVRTKMVSAGRILGLDVPLEVSLKWGPSWGDQNDDDSENSMSAVILSPENTQPRIERRDRPKEWSTQFPAEDTDENMSLTVALSHGLSSDDDGCSTPPRHDSMVEVNPHVDPFDCLPVTSTPGLIDCVRAKGSSKHTPVPRLEAQSSSDDDDLFDIDAQAQSGSSPKAALETRCSGP